MDKIIVDDKTYKVVERKSERFQELLETAMDALQEVPCSAYENGICKDTGKYCDTCYDNSLNLNI